MKRNKLVEIRHRRENGQKEPKIIMNKKQFLKWSRLGSTETNVYTHTHTHKMQGFQSIHNGQVALA